MKLLASDFDGTFHFRDQHDVFLKNIQAVKAFQKENVFAFVTGRNAQSVLSNFKDGDLKIDYLACYNGGRIIDDKGNVLFSDPLTIDLKKLFDVVSKEKIELFSVCSMSKAFYRCFDHRISTHLFMRNYFKDSKIKIVRNIEDVTGDVYMCAIRCKDEKDAMELSKKLRVQFEDCSIYTNTRHIDIVGKKASKKHAVEIIAQHVQPDEVYVIGDSYNDLGMIEHFNSFTVKSANESIQKMADRVVENVSEAIEIII